MVELNDAVDEDNLGVSDTGEPSVGSAIDLGDPTDEDIAAAIDTTPRRKRGRPPKFNNLPADNITRALTSIALGNRQLSQGPTGKPYWVYPSPGERLRAIEMLRATEAATEQAKPKVVEAEPEDARKALGDFLGVDLAPRPPVVPSTEPTAPHVIKDGDSEIISFGDNPEAIKAHDRAIAAGNIPKVYTDSNTKTFDNGFGWIRKFDSAVQKDVWHLINPSGEFCGVRRSQERADSWCLGDGAV